MTVWPEGTLWTSPSAPAAWPLKSRMVWPAPAPFTVMLFLLARFSELVNWYVPAAISMVESAAALEKAEAMADWLIDGSTFTVLPVVGLLLLPQAEASRAADTAVARR